MLDPEGNYIYAHQTPTYHLEMSEQMNSIGSLDELQKSDDYYKDHPFFQDPKFRALSSARKLRILRMLGTRVTSMIKDKNGQLVENNSLDINKVPGKTFGSFTDNTGNVKKGKYEDSETGNLVSFAYSPVLLRVLSESNIADFQNLPIIKSIGEKTLDDASPYEYTFEYLDKWKDIIKREYYRIQKEYTNLKNGIPGKHIGYNKYQNKDGKIVEYSLEDVDKRFIDESTEARAYKFNDAASILTIRKIATKQRELDPKSLRKLTNQ